MSDFLRKAEQLEKSRNKHPEALPLEQLLVDPVDPPEIFVEQMLVEGLTSFISPSKVGKSYLAGGMANALGHGGYALGYLKAKKTGVIYLDLEQAKFQSKKRWNDIVPSGTVVESGQITVFLKWPRMDHGCLETLKDELDKRPHVRVVFIDLFSLVYPLGAPRFSANAYHVEYDLMAQIKDFATKRRIAIVLVHHTNRGQKEDPFETISGTSAIGGCSDAIWFLSRKRGESTGKLYVTGRSIPEFESDLDWDPHCGGWVLANAPKKKS